MAARAAATVGAEKELVGAARGADDLAGRAQVAKERGQSSVTQPACAARSDGKFWATEKAVAKDSRREHRTDSSPEQAMETL